MIKHIILWNLKEEHDNLETKLKIKTGLEALISKVPGIVEIKVNIEPIAGSNASLMLDSTFENLEALEVYQKHEEHIKVATFVRSVVSNRVCMDYEIK